MTVFYSLYDPWVPAGPDRIADGSFSTPAAVTEWSGWNEQIRIEPDGGPDGSAGVVLEAVAGRRSALRFVDNDLAGIRRFRVSLKAAATNVVPGTGEYQTPRILFYFQNAARQSLYSLHHVLAEFTKNRNWKTSQGTFEVPPDAVRAVLCLQQAADEGTLQVAGISIVPVRLRPSAPWWTGLFGLLWGAAFAGCLIALAPWKWRHGFLILAVLGAIMTGIMLPGKVLNSGIRLVVEKSRLIPAVTTVAPGIFTGSPQQESLAEKGEPPPILPLKGATLLAHKAGHLALFSLLAFLCALARLPARPALRNTAGLFAGLLLFAASTEVLQFIMPDRSAGLGDLLVDSFGMAAAVLLAHLLRHPSARLKKPVTA